MTAAYFVDTNILLYAASNAVQDQAKRNIARSVLSRPDIGFSAQVMIDAKERFGISYWDAAILAAAKQMGCHTVYSEDLNAGQDYDGVVVINPFTAASQP